MVTAWLRFALRQIATALVLVTLILLLSEILLPSSILPYFNLHILVLVTLAIAIMSPLIEEKSRWRIILLIPAFALLLVYAWFMFGTSASGLMLFGALAMALMGVVVALCHSREGGNPEPANKVIQSRVEEIIEVEITEEIDVFMR
jgi:hypothetical protein